jgi:hypothetical protein
MTVSYGCLLSETACDSLKRPRRHEANPSSHTRESTGLSEALHVGQMLHEATTRSDRNRLPVAGWGLKGTMPYRTRHSPCAYAKATSKLRD